MTYNHDAGQAQVYNTLFELAVAVIFCGRFLIRTSAAELLDDDEANAEWSNYPVCKDCESRFASRV